MVLLPPLGEAHRGRASTTSRARARCPPSWPSSSATSWATARCTPRACASAWPTATSTSSITSSGSARSCSGSRGPRAPAAGVRRASRSTRCASRSGGRPAASPSTAARGPHREGLAPHVPDAVLHTNDRDVYAAFVRGLYRGRRHRYGRLSRRGRPRRSTSPHEVQTLLLALGLPDHAEADVSGRGSQLGVAAPAEHVVQRVAGSTRSASSRRRKQRRCRQRASRAGGADDHIPVTRALVDRLAPENDRCRKVVLHGGRGAGAIRGGSPRSCSSAAAMPSSDICSGSSTTGRVEPSSVTRSSRTTCRCRPTSRYVANGFVSHNTIGLMMDCDTTGIEPDLGLVKMKKLVGGGTMLIVNQTIPRALRRLGYSDDAGRRRSSPTSTSTRRSSARPRLDRRAPPGVRLLDGRQHDPLHRPREDDGCGPAVHLRRDLQDGATCPRRSRSRTSSSCTSTRGSSASRPSPSTATTARSPSRCRRRRRTPRPCRPSVAAADAASRGRRADRREDRHGQQPVRAEAAPHRQVEHVRVPGGRLQGLRAPSASTTTAGRARSSSRCRSRARPSPGSWTPSPSR